MISAVDLSFDGEIAMMQAPILMGEILMKAGL